MMMILIPRDIFHSVKKADSAAIGTFKYASHAKGPRTPLSPIIVDSKDWEKQKISLSGNIQFFTNSLLSLSKHTQWAHDESAT